MQKGPVLGSQAGHLRPYPHLLSLRAAGGTWGQLKGHIRNLKTQPLLQTCSTTPDPSLATNNSSKLKKQKGKIPYLETPSLRPRKHFFTCPRQGQAGVKNETPTSSSAGREFTPSCLSAAEDRIRFFKKQTKHGLWSSKTGMYIIWTQTNGQNIPKQGQGKLISSKAKTWAADSLNREEGRWGARTGSTEHVCRAAAPSNQPSLCKSCFLNRKNWGGNLRGCKNLSKTLRYSVFSAPSILSFVHSSVQQISFEEQLSVAHVQLGGGQPKANTRWGMWCGNKEMSIWSLSLGTGTQVLKSLEFFWVMGWEKHLSSFMTSPFQPYLSVSWCGDPLQARIAPGWGLVTRKTKPQLAAFSKPPKLQVGKKGCRWSQSPVANDLTNHAFVMKLPSKPLNHWAQAASRLVDPSRCWEGGMEGEGMEALHTFLQHTSPHASHLLAVSALYPIIDWWWAKHSPEFCESF